MCWDCITCGKTIAAIHFHCKDCRAKKEKNSK